MEIDTFSMETYLGQPFSRAGPLLNRAPSVSASTCPDEVVIYEIQHMMQEWPSDRGPIVVSLPGNAALCLMSRSILRSSMMSITFGVLPNEDTFCPIWPGNCESHAHLSGVKCGSNSGFIRVIRRTCPSLLSESVHLLNLECPRASLTTQGKCLLLLEPLRLTASASL